MSTLVVDDEHLFARGRGHLREPVPSSIAQDVAGDQLGQTGVEAADLAVFSLSSEKRFRGLCAAET